MKSPWKIWDKLMFEPAPTRILALFRIAIGLLILLTFILWAPSINLFISDEGFFPLSLFNKMSNGDRFTIFTAISSPFGVNCILTLLFLVCLSFIIGYKTRFSSIVLFLLVISFYHRNTFVLMGVDTVLRCMLFFFMFAPSGKSFSVDALLKKSEESGKAPLWSQRMMQLQLLIIYLFATYSKTSGISWRNGEALYYVFGQLDFSIYGLEQLMNYPLIYSFFTHLIVISEITIPFLLCFRQTRNFAALFGIGLHGFILVAMKLLVFSLAMIASYIPFFSDRELESLLRKIRNRFSNAKASIYYDGYCPLCRRTVKILGSFDLFYRLNFLNARECVLPQGIDKEVAFREMHLVTHRGKILKGYKAFRFITVRMAATFWLTPFLYFPGVSYLGSFVYGLVAKNRKIALQCDDREACK